jgi:carbonic anhydrase
MDEFDPEQARGAQRAVEALQAHERAQQAHELARQAHGQQQGSSAIGEANLERLRAGNERFLSAIAHSPDPAGVTATLAKAEPYAIVLGCSDSRVPPEIVFNESIGRLFVIRVAGNVAGNEETGTIEYALALWGCPLVVVLGHTQCAGVAAAMDRPPQGLERPIDPSGSMNLSALIARIRSNLGWTRDWSSTDPWTDAVRLNVRRTIEQMLTWSLPIRRGVESGNLMVVGAIYHVETGEVDFFVP